MPRREPGGVFPPGDRRRRRRDEHGRRRRRDEHGQATVELALCLPLLFVVLLGVVQLVVVVRDQILLVHAAREAVRQAAVGGMSDAQTAATRAAVTGSGLDVHRLTVRIHSEGAATDTVGVQLTYRVPTSVAVVGRLLGEVRLEAHAVMRRETRS